MRVVIAFIVNSHRQLLCTQRSYQTDFPGYWELPGGKVELHEFPLQALARELKEELNLELIKAQCFAKVAGKTCFYLYHVTEFSGQLLLQVGQLAYQWLDSALLSKYQFPPSNQRFFMEWLNSDDSKLQLKT